MINFSDKENIKKLIELEKISLTSTINIQKNLNKQILIFMKNFMANIEFPFDIDPNDKAFFYLNESTCTLNKSNSNITSLKNLINYLNKIHTSSENLEEEIKSYNNNFKESFNTIYENTEQIEKFIYDITTTDFSELSINFNTISTEEPSDAISSKDLSASFIEDTLIISETQKKVFLPYSINKVKDILLNNEKKYSSIQDVINKLYTKPISYYKIPSVARFKEAYKLIKEKEKGSNFKALGLAFELLGNYNLHPAIISSCNSLDELDIYLACLEENALEDFQFFDIKYEIPLAISKLAKD